MADRLQAELAQTRLEFQHLKERMETGAVTVHKDLFVLVDSQMVRLRLDDFPRGIFF